MGRNCAAERSTSGPIITACGCSSSSRASRSRTRTSRGFNARLRKECLNEHVFVSFDHASNKIEGCPIEYNRERPHSSLGNLTPEEFAAKHQMSSAIARTAWPAAEPELADAVQRALASDPKLIVFRPPSDDEGRLEKLGRKNETNPALGYEMDTEGVGPVALPLG